MAEIEGRNRYLVVEIIEDAEKESDSLVLLPDEAGKLRKLLHGTITNGVKVTLWLFHAQWFKKSLFVGKPST